MLRTIWATLVAINLLHLAGCASTPEEVAQDSINLARPFSAEHYAVAPTDVLRVDVYREPDLSDEYYVDPSGTINMPLIGRIGVAGLNIQAIEHHIKRKLAAGLIVDPDVRVAVVKFRPIFVTGEVNKTGRYPFTPGMTVQQAVVLAGGLTRFAAKKYYLQRNNSSENMQVDGASILSPGDVITVGERLF